MGLFRSEKEILEEEQLKKKGELQKEADFEEFFKDIILDLSKEDVKILEKIRTASKNYSKNFYTPSMKTGEYWTFYGVSSSIVVNLNILKQLTSSKKKIENLNKQNKELENKFDTLIKQNEELNNKFDTLIEILKSK